MWADEHGMKAAASEDDILLAQIEDHRTEVFYDMSPSLHAADFLRRLPGCVRRTLTWWAAPNPGPSLSQYDLVICNFPNLSRQHEARGCKTAYFSPAHDPVMNEYAANPDRPIDVLFVGTYSRHHVQRNRLLLEIAKLGNDWRLSMHLQNSRLTRLAESTLGRLLPLGKYRRPAEIRAIAGGPLFGRDFYATMSQAKIAINGSGEIAGMQRGNMRCFEAMGCRNLLLTDDGIYPDGMQDDRTLVTYSSVEDAQVKITALLRDPQRLHRIARDGFAMITKDYSKERQWAHFQELAS